MATTVNPQKRKHIDFAEETIIVEVGHEGKRFTVHPSVLTANSAFFRAMMASSWKETFQRMARLPGADAIMFGVYIAYVYSGNITPKFHSSEDITEETDPTGRHQYHCLAKLYVLADMLQDTAFKNKLINMLLDLIRIKGGSPFVVTIDLAFKSSRHDGALCTLLIDSFVAKTDPVWLNDVYSDLHPAFLQALMVGWAAATWESKAMIQGPEQGDPCKYHEHDEDAPIEGSCWKMPGKVAASKAVKETPRKGKRSARLAQKDSPDSLGLNGVLD